MDTPVPPAKPLNVPLVGAAHFSKNFIRLAVCELRFPTLFELEADRPPLGFAKVVRKEYPLHDLLKNVNPGSLAQSSAHSFRSKNGRWTVTLRAAALSLETSNYDTFSEFEERLGFVLKAAEGIIDSDFFTRVGLRYINTMPFALSELKQWVNSALVSPLGEETFGDVEEHWQRVRGLTTVGGYLFQHGLDTNPQARRREYILDFDFYREDVTIPETLSIVRQLHDQEYAMFAWSLGDKAKEHLGPSTLEE